MNFTKVENMQSAKGNDIANQFVMTDKSGNITFQSYDSVIAVKTRHINGNRKILLDTNYWDYSVTTGKYRNLFLGEKKAETQRKIDSGEYELRDLN